MKDARSTHGAILFLDIDRFSIERTDVDRTLVRTQLQEIVKTVLQSAQITIGGAIVNDTGDGLLILPSADADKTALIKTALPGLERALAVHNHKSSKPLQLRVRAVLHFGEYMKDAGALNEKGATGNAINIAGRLLDSQDLRKIVREQPLTRPLAYLMSSNYYEEIVKQQLPELADRYSKIVVITKDRQLSAWIPSELAPKQSKSNGQNGSSPKASTGDLRRAAQSSSSMTIVARFMNRMDALWENELDEAWVVVHRLDYHAEQNIAVLLDEFFQEYHRVFDALVRQRKNGATLDTLASLSITKAEELAARVWELVADAKIKKLEEHDDVGRQEVIESWRRAKRSHPSSTERLISMRAAYEEVARCLAGL